MPVVRAGEACGGEQDKSASQGAGGSAWRLAGGRRANGAKLGRRTEQGNQGIPREIEVLTFQ